MGHVRGRFRKGGDFNKGLRKMRSVMARLYHDSMLGTVTEQSSPRSLRDKFSLSSTSWGLQY